MLCEEARRWMELTRDDTDSKGNPTDGMRQLLEEHLDRCPSCRHYREWLRQTDEAIASAMRNVAVPPDLKTSLLERFAERPAALPYTSMRRSPVAWLAAAAVLTALVIGGLWYGRHTNGPQAEVNQSTLVQSLESLTPDWDKPLTQVPPAEAWRAWTEHVVGGPLPWPWAVRDVQMVRTGTATIHGKRAYVSEWRFQGNSLWLVLLPTRDYVLPAIVDRRARVLKDSQSLSVAAWRTANAYHALLYRGPLYEVNAILPKARPRRVVLAQPPLRHVRS